MFEFVGFWGNRNYYTFKDSLVNTASSRVARTTQGNYLRTTTTKIVKRVREMAQKLRHTG